MNPIWLGLLEERTDGEDSPCAVEAETGVVPAKGHRVTNST